MSANATPVVGGLRDLRRAAGLSQQSLAALAGCSISYVRVLEAGYRPAGGDVLERIADALAAQNDERPVATPGARESSDAEWGDARVKS